MFWAKYATQTTFEFPMIKRGAVDFAQTGDWTPASTDAAISKDNGNAADTANTVAIVGGSPTRGTSLWKLTLTNTELTAAEVTVQIVDAATKVVEDQAFTVYTYGHPSAKFAGDWSDIVRLGLTALPNAVAEAAGGLYTRGAGAGQIAQDANGRIDVNLKADNGTAQTAGDIMAALAIIATYIDTEISTLLTRIGTPSDLGGGASVAANLSDIEAQTDDIGAAGAGLTAITGKTNLIPGTQDGYTFAQLNLLMAVTLLGKASGMGTTTGIFRALDDSKDRVTATQDADGNRTAVVRDAS